MMSHKSLLLLVLMIASCSGNNDPPQVGVDSGVDSSTSASDSGDGPTRECAKHSNDPNACSAAGCDLQAFAIRMCINDDDRCVLDDNYEICAFANGATGADLVSTGYFAHTDEGTFVVQTSIHHGFRNQAEWQSCTEDLGPLVPGAPEECRCVNDPKAIEGECP